MIVLLNSSKTLDFETTSRPGRHSIPEFIADAELLAKQLRRLAPAELMKLMGVSEKLARLNAQRYREFQTPFTPDNAGQALAVFKGDVYSGLDVDRYSAKDFEFAQEHVRILAGLYGILRPLDLIQPYRLEMGYRLKTRRGSNLYEFWGERITAALNRCIVQEKSGLVINMASQEYFKGVNTKRLNARVITPAFKELKNGRLRTVALYTKKARGMLCDFIVQGRIGDIEALKSFDRGGYHYDSGRSTENKWAFVRLEA